MASRVLHLRLDDWVILGCHDILKAGPSSIDNIPMATIVRQVLTALVRKMQNTNQIPSYSKEETMERALELYAGALELDLDVALKDIIAMDDQTSDNEMEDLLKETLRQIENEGAPEEISMPVEMSEVEEVAVIEKPTLDLFNQDCRTFADIEKESPKDRFVEWASTQNKLIQQAVAVTYSGLPKQMWGSDKAEDMIKDMLERHRK